MSVVLCGDCESPLLEEHEIENDVCFKCMKAFENLEEAFENYNSRTKVICNE